MKIGVVGGGIMGLATARGLAADGHAVTVLERAAQLGGLATYHEFGDFHWDRFYHVILPSDVHLLRFLREIGLGDRLRWRATRTGYFVDGQFHSLSNNVDFLRFAPLTLWEKARLAATIVYASRISDWRRLEQQPVEAWLIRVGGRNTFDKFWKPLLLAKLGTNYRRVSAVFIWSYIKRLFSARDAAASKEQLGYVCGGYRTVIERLQELILQAGGSVRTRATVREIQPADNGGLRVSVDGADEHFDKVIVTSPVNVLRRLVSPDLLSDDGGGGDIEYLGVICMALVTTRPISPYYVLNIADPDVPFTGVIGMSNVVSTDETAGLHLTYLPWYVPSDDALLELPDETVRERFLAGLSHMYPDLDRSILRSVHVNRAVKVQPLQVVGYSRKVPSVDTRHPDLYVLNTSQFVDNTLNNNELVRNVDQFLSRHRSDFEQRVSRVAAQPAMPTPEREAS